MPDTDEAIQAAKDFLTRNGHTPKFNGLVRIEPGEDGATTVHLDLAFHSSNPTVAQVTVSPDGKVSSFALTPESSSK